MPGPAQIFQLNEAQYLALRDSSQQLCFREDSCNISKRLPQTVGQICSALLAGTTGRYCTADMDLQTALLAPVPHLFVSKAEAAHENHLYYH
jgi:hypothetical protein